NHVSRLHLLACDESILSEEAARVVDGRIETQDLLYYGTKKIGLGCDLVAYLQARSQCEKRIADQTRGCLVRLRKEADPIRDNDIRLFAPIVFHLSRKDTQQTIFTRQ